METVSTITNHSNEKLVYKILVTAPELFLVYPHSGELYPEQSTEIKLTMLRISQCEEQIHIFFAKPSIK